MTRPRSGRASARGESSGGRGARRSAPAASGQQQMMIFGGLGAAALVVALVFVFGGKSPSGDTTGTGATPAADPQRNDPPPAVERRSTPAPSGTARAGKPPGRPAPTIESAQLELAERRYRAGVAKWNEAQRAQRAGDQTSYAEALEAAFHELEAQRDALREYTDWFEEADLEGWAMPAEYDALQRKLNEYDPTYQKVKKLKQIGS